MLESSGSQVLQEKTGGVKKITSMLFFSLQFAATLYHQTAYSAPPCATANAEFLGVNYGSD